MEKITVKRLKDAGWFENRKIDISVFLKKYNKIGLEMPANIANFLEKFGMLNVDASDKKYFDVHFDPLKAIGIHLDADYFRECLLEYGINENVYPIGVAHRDNLFILMTLDNVTYCFTDGCLLKAGTSIEEMLDCLVGECVIAKQIY